MSPATSIKQKQLMAIALHHPDLVKAKNRAVLAMSKGQLHDFASTSEKGLPKKKKTAAERLAAMKKERAK